MWVVWGWRVNIVGIVGGCVGALLVVLLEKNVLV